MVLSLERLDGVGYLEGYIRKGVGKSGRRKDGKTESQEDGKSERRKVRKAIYVSINDKKQ